MQHGELHLVLSLPFVVVDFRFHRRKRFFFRLLSSVTCLFKKTVLIVFSTTVVDVFDILLYRDLGLDRVHVESELLSVLL